MNEILTPNVEFPAGDEPLSLPSLLGEWESIASVTSDEVVNVPT